MIASYPLTEIRPYIGDLVVRAQAGEQIIITRYGKPAAMLVPIPGQQAGRARVKQLSDYFNLLIGLAEKAEDKQHRDDLFDRIERTIAEVVAECAPHSEVLTEGLA